MDSFCWAWGMACMPWHMAWHDVHRHSSWQSSAAGSFFPMPCPAAACHVISCRASSATYIHHQPLHATLPWFKLRLKPCHATPRMPCDGATWLCHYVVPCLRLAHQILLPCCSIAAFQGCCGWRERSNSCARCCTSEAGWRPQLVYHSMPCHAVDCGGFLAMLCSCCCILMSVVPSARRLHPSIMFPLTHTICSQHGRRGVRAQRGVGRRGAVAARSGGGALAAAGGSGGRRCRGGLEADGGWRQVARVLG